MQLKPGTRLRSAAGSTEVVVVRAPADDVDLRCGGHPMLAMSEQPPDGLAVAVGFDDGSQVGKRYADDAVGIELLCTKAGLGSLSLGADPLALKGAKPLPSSD